MLVRLRKVRASRVRVDAVKMDIRTYQRTTGLSQKAVTNVATSLQVTWLIRAGGARTQQRRLSPQLRACIAFQLQSWPTVIHWTYNRHGQTDPSFTCERMKDDCNVHVHKMLTCCVTATLAVRRGGYH